MWDDFEKSQILARDIFETSQRRHGIDIFIEICSRRVKDVTQKTSFLRCFWDVLKTPQKSNFFRDVSVRSLRCLSQGRSDWDLSETWVMTKSFFLLAECKSFLKYVCMKSGFKDFKSLKNLDCWSPQTVVTGVAISLTLTLFRMGIFGASHGSGGGGAKRPPSLKSVTHILQWWILAQLYLT